MTWKWPLFQNHSGQPQQCEGNAIWFSECLCFAATGQKVLFGKASMGGAAYTLHCGTCRCYHFAPSSYATGCPSPKLTEKAELLIQAAPIAHPLRRQRHTVLSPTLCTRKQRSDISHSKANINSILFGFVRIIKCMCMKNSSAKQYFFNILNTILHSANKLHILMLLFQFLWGAWDVNLKCVSTAPLSSFPFFWCSWNRKAELVLSWKHL